MTTPATVKFDNLYTEFAPLVKRAVASFLRDPSDQEDAAQNVWIKVDQALQAGTRIGNVKSWLHEIAKNEALMIIRSTKSDHVTESVEEMIEAGKEPADDPYQEPTIDPRLKSALRVSVDSLPAKTREAVSRFYFGSQPVSKIAHEMGVTQSTVTSHLVHGRNALRSLFTRSTERNAA